MALLKLIYYFKSLELIHELFEKVILIIKVDITGFF